MCQNESELELFFQFPTPLYLDFNQYSAWATSTLYIIAFVLLFTRLHGEHVQASMYVGLYVVLNPWENVQRQSLPHSLGSSDSQSRKHFNHESIQMNEEDD